MSAEDTITPEWYAPWPNLGKKLSEQLGEIRNDTAAMAPLVRGMGLDASGDFSNLDGIAAAAVQSRELGQQDFPNRFRTHYNKADDLFEIASNTGTSLVPNWYTTWTINKDGQVTQQNTPTTASNVGSGQGWFKQKSGVDLEFRSITATSPITIVNDGNSIDVDGSALVSTYSSLGGDVNLVDTKVGNDLPFKGLTAGSSTVLTDNGDSIRIDSTAQIVEFYGIVVQHSDGSAVFPGVHILKVNIESFYLTKQIRSNEVLLNSRGDNLRRDEFVATTGDEMSGALSMFEGTVSLPALTWTGDLDTGIRHRAADDMAFVSGGADIARVLTDRFLVSKQLQVTTVTNTPSTPDIFFNPDSDTGLYQLTSNDGTIAFATAGVAAGHFDSAQDFFVTNEIKAGDGNATTPTYSFSASSQQNLGMYRNTTDELAFSVAGTRRLLLKTALSLFSEQIQGPDGDAGTPTYSFGASGQSDVGMYRKAEDSIAFSTGGSERMYFASTGKAFFAHPVNVPDGSSGAPAYSFTATGSTGIYRDDPTDSVRITSSSTAVIDFDSANIRMRQAVTADGIILGADGSASAPEYSFTSDPDTGLFRNGTNQLAFTTGGTEAGYFDAAQNLHVTKTLQAGIGDFATSMNAPTGVFYTTVDIGSGAPGDSIIEFFEESTLRYTVGHDASRQALILTSGQLDDTNNELVIQPSVVTVNNDIIVHSEAHAAKVIAGTGEFYEQLRIADGGVGAPGLAFLSDPDTGFFLSASNVVRFLTGGGKRLEIADTYTYIINKLRFPNATSLSALASQFNDDTDTGIYHRGDNEFAWATGGVEAGYFDANQNFHVLNDVKSSRVEAGIGTFYTNLYIPDGKEAVPGLSFNSAKTTGIYLTSSDQMAFTFKGSERLSFNFNFVIAAKPLLAPQGTKASPGFSWNVDSGSGMYSRFGTADDRGEIAFSTFGTQVARVHSGTIVRPEQAHKWQFNFGIISDVDAEIRGDVKAGRIHAGPSVFYIQDEGTSSITVSPGSAANPALTFTSDLNTGLFRKGTDQLGFTTNATEAGYFDSSQNLFVTNAINLGGELIGTPDAITATSTGVAASVATLNTEVTTNDDNDLDNVTLANGTSGQIKHIFCVVSFAGDTWKITPSTMLGGSIITFGDNSVGDGCTLVYADNEGWVVVGNNGGTIS